MRWELGSQNRKSQPYLTLSLFTLCLRLFSSSDISTAADSSSSLSLVSESLSNAPIAIPISISAFSPSLQIDMFFSSTPWVGDASVALILRAVGVVGEGRSPSAPSPVMLPPPPPPPSSSMSLLGLVLWVDSALWDLDGALDFWFWFATE